MYLSSDANCTKIGIFFKLIIVVLLSKFIYSHFIFFDETILKNVDMLPFAEPIQEDIIEGETFVKELSVGPSHITPIAKYQIYGRVLQEHYRPSKLKGAEMYPFDVSIGYGPFKHKEMFDAVKIRMASSVAYMFYSHSNWTEHISKYIADKPYTINHYFSNNHLCPANENIKKGLDQLKKKDIVYLEGYLIKYKLLRNDGFVEQGYSSTLRDDDFAGNNRDGNCEQIYVTRVVTRRGDYR